MKKRIIAILLTAILMIGVLAGCDVITKNEERDLDQAIATVSYEGLTGYVTKGDLLEAFNSYGYYYVNYYSYTTEETFDLLVESLAQRELLILYARKYHADLLNVAADGSIENMLTLNEIKYGIEQINESMESSLTSIIKELQEEIDAAAEEEEEDDAPIQLVEIEEMTYTKGDTFDPSDYQIQITDEDGNVTTVALTEAMYDANNLPDMTTVGDKTFTVTYEGVQYSIEFTVSGLTARAVRPEEGEAEFDAEAVYTGALPAKFGEAGYVYESEYDEDGVKNTLFDSALKELNDNMASNYKTYDEYFQNQLETLLLNSLKRKISAGELTTEKVAAQLETSAAVLVNKNIEAFAKLDTAYATALASGASGIGYYPTDGYGFVYNILLKFSDEQTAELAKYSGTSSTQGALYTTDEAYYAIRDMLADEITVDISNIFYDADYECENDGEIGADGFCTCGNLECPANAYIAYDVPVASVLAWIKSDLDAARAITNKYERMMAINEVALQWVYRLNDDTGMFNKDTTNGITNAGLGYLVTPEGEKSTYVDEFTAQARALIGEGIGSYATDYNDIKTMYCVTDYGIHILVVSYIPYDFEAFDINGVNVFDNQAQYDTRKLPLDYIIEYGQIIGAEGHFTKVEGALTYTFDIAKMYGEDTKLNVSEVNTTVTLGSSLEDTLRTNIATDVYNYNARQLFYTNWDEKVKINEKKLAKLYED